MRRDRESRRKVPSDLGESANTVYACERRNGLPCLGEERDRLAPATLGARDAGRRTRE